MDFKQFIALELGKDRSKCSDSKYVISEFKKTVQDSKDVIQFIQLNILLSYANFIDNLIIPYEHKSKKELASAVELLSKAYDDAKISIHIYAYFMYCILNGLSFPTDEVHWIDPRIDNLSDPSISGNDKTFGLGAYSESATDFEVSAGTLRKLKIDREIVTVPNGVTELDSSVFANKSRIKYVFLPKTLKTIKQNAFSGMGQLEFVILPSSITELPSGIFRNCSSLKLVLAEGVKAIGDNAFENTQLTSLKRVGGNQLERIGSSAFKGCSKLRGINAIDASVKPDSLVGCAGMAIVSISVSSSIQTVAQLFGNNISNSQLALEKMRVKFEDGKIPSGFFKGCKNLSHVEVVGNVSRIGADAFADCTALKVLNGEFNLQSVGAGAFAACSSLTSVEFKSCPVIGEGAFSNCKSLTSIKIGGQVSSVGSRAFSNCENLSILDISLCTKEVPSYCFENCRSLNVSTLIKGVEVFEPYALSTTKVDDSFVFPANIKHIKTNAFAGTQSSIQTLKVPSNVIIEKGAFSGLGVVNIVFSSLNINDSSGRTLKPYELFDDSLESFNSKTKIVNVKVGCSTVPAAAFLGWKKLQKVIFGPSITEVPDSCLEGCSSLVGIKFMSENIILGSKALKDCTSLKTLIFGDSTNKDSVSLAAFKSIGANALENCNAFTKVILPSVDKIKPQMLQGCYGLTEVSLSIPDAETDRVFIELFESNANDFTAKYANLKKISILSGNRIPAHFFEGLRNVEEIYVADKVTSLGDYSFSNCSSLKNLSMNYVGKSLPGHCFAGCMSLNMSGLLEGIEVLEPYSLASMKIDNSFKFPSSLKRVKKNAFAETEMNLSVLNLPKGVIFEKGSLFGVQVTTVAFGSLDEKDEHGNEILPYMYFDDSLDSFNSSCKIENIKITSDNVCEKAFKGWKTIKKVIYQSNSNVIPESCFEECTSLEAIKIVGSGAKVYRNAFKGCSSLARITTDNAVDDEFIHFNSFDSIGAHAFADCSSLTKVDLFGVKSIDSGMLSGCSSISEVKFDIAVFIKNNLSFHQLFSQDINSFKMIFGKLDALFVNADGAIPTKFFSNLESVKKIVINGSVSSLGTESFKGCSSLSELSMNFTGTEIPHSCFENCAALPSLPDFGNSTSIGDKAFANCEKIQRFASSKHINHLGRSAFENCYSLVSIESVFDVKEIPDFAFSNCRSLEKILIPQAVSVADNAFVMCNAIKAIEVGNIDSKKIYDIFENCQIIEEIRYHAGAIIPDFFFSSLKGLKTLDIIGADNVEIIGSNSFSTCVQLTTLPLFKNVKTIRSFAFKNTGLVSFDIPDSVEYLGVGIFDGCFKLQSLSTPLLIDQLGMLFAEERYQGSKEIRSFDYDCPNTYYLPETLETIKITKFSGGVGALSGVNVVDIVIRDSIETIPDYCFYQCKSRVTMPLYDTEIIGHHAFEESLIVPTSLSAAVVVGEYAFASCKGFTKLKFGSKLKLINFNCLKDTEVVSISLKDSNENYIDNNGVIIDKRAKKICFVSKDISGNVTIDKDVTSIEAHSFSGCVNIESVKLGECITSIGDGAFENCVNLHTFSIASDDISLGQSVLFGCFKVKNLTLPYLGLEANRSGTLSDLFGDDSVASMRNMKRMSLVVRRGSIVPGFASGVSDFAKLDISLLDITRLRDGLFSGLTIGTLCLPDNVTIEECDNPFIHAKIAKIIAKGIDSDQNFVYCGSKILFMKDVDTSSILIRKDVTELAPSLFEYVEKIDRLVIESPKLKTNSSLKTVRINELQTTDFSDRGVDFREEFKGSCGSLTMLVYSGASLVKGSLETFAKLTDVTMDELLTLPSRCFSNNIVRLNLLSLRSATEIENYALDCVDVTNLILGPAFRRLPQQELNKWVIESISLEGNSKFKCVDGMLILDDKLIYATKDKNKKELIVPSFVKSIAPYAFCGSTAKVIRTTSVTEIGEFAFSKMKSIGKLYISDAVEHIGKLILQGSNPSGIKVPFIGDTLKSAECEGYHLTYFFGVEMNGAIELPVPESLNKVVVTKQKKYGETFSRCSGIKEIVIPDNATSIGDNCFKFCYNMKSFYVPRSVKSVGDRAFYGCGSDFRLYVHNKSQTLSWSAEFNLEEKKSGWAKVITFGIVKDKKINISYSDWKEPNYEL